MQSYIKQKIYNLLRYSENYTQTDMVYFASGGFWLALGQVISTIASFLLLIAFANFVPKEVYGSYQYILATAGILAIATLTSMKTAVARASARGFEGTFLKALKERMKWGLLGAVGSLLVALYYFLEGNPTLTISFLIVGIFLPFMDPLAVFNSHLQGKKLFKVATVYGIVFHSIRAALIILVLYVTNNILLILATYFISTTILRFFLFQYTKNRYTSNNTVEPGALIYGKHLSLMDVLGQTAIQIDKILIWHFLGPAPLAIYSFSLSPVVRLQSLVRLLEPLALPKFATTQVEVIKKTLPKKLFRFLLLLIPITIVYILVAPWIYKIFFPNYLDSVIFSQVFAIVILFAPQKLIGTALTIHANKKSLYIIYTLGPVSKIITLIVLLPLYGIWGGIAGMIAPYIINFLTSTYFFKKL